MPSNQPSHTLSISEAAEAVGVTIHSVRRWAEWHSAYLNPGANPPAGQPKRFTGRDVEVLRHVKALRGEGLQTIAINDKLSGLTFPEIEPNSWPDGMPNNSDAMATDSAVTVADSIEASPGAQQSQEGAILAIQVFDAINAQNRKIEALERSAETNKQEQRERWVWIVVGIVLGLGLAVVFELAALVAHR